MTNPDFSELKD